MADAPSPTAVRPPEATDPPAEAAGHGSGRWLAKAAGVTAALTAAGALLGLFRDQLLASHFGAGPETDAFLVAWTVPEFAATLLIEDGMALVLVPAFAAALARRPASPGPGPDPVRALVRATLPGAVLVLGAAAALLALAAPWLVTLLAPGLARSALAVDCVRLTASCVLSFALAGYCSAALRAHGSFAAPAAIYVAHNAGIIAAIVLLGPLWGVRAAAAGVAAGGVLMVLLQAPGLWRRLKRPADSPRGPAAADRAVQAVAWAVVAPVLAFAVSRQSQVLVERFLAAPLPAGAISHLNYAQKVAQLPMTLSLMVCTVSFPVVARALAAGDTAAARRRAERDLLLAGLIVLLGAATVLAAAPQIVRLLFERGAFDPADTAATAAVMRVYALGLLGHTLVGALVRCSFSAARPLWHPAAAMLAGIAATAVAGQALAGVWGAPGIAAGNALGITLTAGLLLAGARRGGVPLGARALLSGLVRLAAAALAAATAGRLCAVGPPLLAVTLATAAVAVVLPAAALALRAPLVPALAAAAAARLRRRPAARRP
ncbi:murein biosynthesis integral membrane protein MurJ [Streptomyces sp. ODS05-4]|uniref:murein biosynthesis integral membrane protein MurJ n=1 Tax=Streptomyces sp. ODS05-4 TaxID=2944939 RepID=UPI002108B06B|nr:lipid II flippase MurJ [Streptomyces sp. ODS05-4]